ncbi:MAG: hypothetical protein IPM81_04235 [Saprospirales bacterium]|nr:hypothetical protein [Saprospirales bacterium]
MKKSKGNKLNKLTREEIENGLEFQSKFGWTFYSERELLENAVTQQVNFVVAAYATFIAAARFK